MVILLKVGMLSLTQEDFSALKINISLIFIFQVIVYVKTDACSKLHQNCAYISSNLNDFIRRIMYKVH